MWAEENGKLVNRYEFKDFKAAILFINELAKICDEVNHHPEIYNCYNFIVVNIYASCQIYYQKEIFS